MSVPYSVSHYLANTRADYTLVHHDHTASSCETARLANIKPSSLMKAVVLYAVGNDHLVMAVVPASHRINLRRVGAVTGMELDILPEDQLAQLFFDCEFGAVPPFGDAYDIDTVWDDALLEKAELYGEAGDHTELIHIDAVQFRELFWGRPHGMISEPVVH